MSRSLSPRADASAPVALVAAGSMHDRGRVRDALRRTGIRRIYEASDGAEAAGMLDAVSPDLLILDWELDVIGTPEIVRLAHGSRPDGGTPPIVLTMARPRRTDVERAVALGLSNIVAKPFSAGLLRTRIAAARMTAF